MVSCCNATDAAILLPLNDDGDDYMTLQSRNQRVGWAQEIEEVQRMSRDQGPRGDKAGQMNGCIPLSPRLMSWYVEREESIGQLLASLEFRNIALHSLTMPLPQKPESTVFWTILYRLFNGLHWVSEYVMVKRAVCSNSEKNVVKFVDTLELMLNLLINSFWKLL